MHARQRILTSSQQEKKHVLKLLTWKKKFLLDFYRCDFLLLINWTNLSPNFFALRLGGKKERQWEDKRDQHAWVADILNYATISPLFSVPPNSHIPVISTCLVVSSNCFALNMPKSLTIKGYQTMMWSVGWLVFVLQLVCSVTWHLFGLRGRLWLHN